MMTLSKSQGPLVFMFSGQGSQYYQMGRELFLNNALFRSWMLEMDHLSGESVIEALYDPQKKIGDPFDQLLMSHLAIFMVEYALYQTLNLKPDAVLGASLGEFTAATISGALTVEETLKCLIKQVQLIEKVCKPGKMVAILANPELFEVELSAISELVSVNGAKHFVISTSSNHMTEIQQILTNRQATYLVLPVSYGFHSAQINSIEEEYVSYLKTIEFKKLVIPLISSCKGKAVSKVDAEFIWEVIRKPICFVQAVNFLEDRESYCYLDLGPSGTLTNFAKQIIGDRCSSIMTPFHQEICTLEKIYKLFS